MKTVLKYRIVFAAFLIAAVYFLTLAPTVVHIDCGELAAVQATLGIAHPTGYPLFTLLGHVFSKLPIGHAIIFRLNLLALLWTITGIFFFMHAAQRLVTKHVHEQQQPAPTRGIIAAIPALAAGMFLAFGRTIWSLSTSVEVYSLQLALVALVLYTATRAFYDDSDSPRFWYLAAFALALGFANHMTTVLLLPGLAYLFFVRHGWSIRAWQRLAIITAILLLVAGSLYLYLPLRAAQEPVLNWGDPGNWHNFFRQVTGKQFQVWMFSSAAVAHKNLRLFLHNLPAEFGWIGLALAVPGLAYSLIRQRQFGAFLLITAIATVLYAINYDIHDLDSYFLPAFLVMGLWIAIGTGVLLRLAARNRLALGAGIAITVIAIVHLGLQNFAKVDRSDTYLYEDYTRQALAALPEDAVLLSYQWDYLISPAYYLQFVEGFRRDVAVIDKELLRRSWYFKQLRRNYPQVVGAVEPEIAGFLQALAPFERGGRYNAAILEARYRRLIARLIETGVQRGAVYLAPELVENELQRGQIFLPPQITLIPDGMFFKVMRRDDAYHLAQRPPLHLRWPRHEDEYTAMVRKFVAKMLSWRALYELQFQKTERARALLQQLRTVAPDFPLPPALAELAKN